MAITYWAGGIIRGLSTDTKPDHAGLNNYNFVETDTGNIWRHNGTAWFKILHGRRDTATGRISHPTYRYTIYKDAFFNYKCYDNYEGAIVSSSSNAEVPIQYAIDNGDTQGQPYGVFIAGGAGILGQYDVANPIIPKSFSNIVGEAKNLVRIRPTGNWPAFDLTGKSHVTIRDMSLFQTNGTYTTGLIRVRANTGVILNNRIMNCNFVATGSGSGIGNCVWVENDTVTGLGNVGPTNTYMIDCYSTSFEWFCRLHCVQDGDWHQAVYIDRCFIDSFKEGVMKTTYDGSSGVFDNIIVSNTNAQPLPGFTNANAICFNFDNGGSHQYHMQSNNLMWDLTASQNYMSVGTGAVGINMVNCIPDHKFTGSGYTAANDAGKINRKSNFSRRSGKSVQSGAPGKNWFDIAHGLSTTPNRAWVQSNQNFTNILSFGSTNITVTMSGTPAEGTNNVVIYWEAEV